MNRQEMILKLIEASVEAVDEDRDREWLRDIFRGGFQGYAQMNDAQLSTQLRMRGLLEFDEPDLVPDDDDEEFDDDDDELTVLYAEMMPVPALDTETA